MIGCLLFDVFSWLLLNDGLWGGGNEVAGDSDPVVEDFELAGFIIVVVLPVHVIGQRINDNVPGIVGVGGLSEFASKGTGAEQEVKVVGERDTSFVNFLWVIESACIGGGDNAIEVLIHDGEVWDGCFGCG